MSSPLRIIRAIRCMRHPALSTQDPQVGLKGVWHVLLAGCRSRGLKTQLAGQHRARAHSCAPSPL